MKMVYHEDFLKDTQGFGHPECPERLVSILERMTEMNLKPHMITPEPAELADVLTVHENQYLEFLENFGSGRLDSDTSVLPHTYEMALLAAGGGIAAVENMMAHNEPTFALLRPPGHHATAVMGMGFCYLNNVAIAANWLRKKFDRVAIVDIDVHHGNGTNDTFLDRPDVLYVSTHQYGIYPGTGPASQTGTGMGEGYTVNIPLGARCGDSTFIAARDKVIIPILEQFKPDAILISLGADAHYMDPLASLTLSTPGYLQLVGEISRLAADICDNRWAVFLEGGYNLNALADVVCNSMASADGDQSETTFNEVSDQNVYGADYVSGALKIQSRHWDL